MLAFAHVVILGSSNLGYVDDGFRSLICVICIFCIYLYFEIRAMWDVRMLALCDLDSFQVGFHLHNHVVEIAPPKLYTHKTNTQIQKGQHPTITNAHIRIVSDLGCRSLRM